MIDFWTRADWDKLDKFIGVLAIFIISMSFIPSSWFYNPKSVAINGYEVTVHRSYPFGWLFRPRIRYIEQVRAIDRPTDPCTDPDRGGFKYLVDKPFGQWNIEDWAARCMTGDYVWSAEWRVVVFGVIPLRPVEAELIVAKNSTAETGA